MKVATSRTHNYYILSSHKKISFGFLVGLNSIKSLPNLMHFGEKTRFLGYKMVGSLD
jgi:hypothetical protein